MTSGKPLLFWILLLNFNNAWMVPAMFKFELLWKHFNNNGWITFNRVSCYGNATIVEVAYQTKTLTPKESEEGPAEKTKREEEVREISNQLKVLAVEKEKIELRIGVISKEQKILESYSECVSSVSTKELYYIQYICYNVYFTFANIVFIYRILNVVLCNKDCCFRKRKIKLVRY